MRLLLLITAALVLAAAPACADPLSAALVTGVTALGTAGTVGGAIGTFLVNTALATGFSYLARAVMPKSSTKASASTSQQTLELTINADLPRQLVLGARAVGGSLHYFCKFGPQNENVDLIIVLADHEIASLEKLWVNGTGVSMHIDENGYQDVPEFHDKYGISMLSFRLYKGTPGQPADAEVIGDSGGQWTSGHTLSGCAYVKVRIVFNPDVWGGELPTLLWLVRGAKLYDPRKDSTMPGGFGAHRWGYPETYEFADSLELCRYNYLRGIYNNGDRWFGVGLAADEIDTAKSIAAMNACEEMVLCRDGTYEPRYRCAAVIDADEDHASVLAKFSTACAGSMPDLSGMYALQPGVAQIPVIGFTDADLIEGADLTGSRHQSLGDVANEVTGTWADPSALYQSGSVPTRFSYDDEALDGGFRRSAPYDLSFIYSQSQGQRCLEIYRRLVRRQITHTLTLRRRYAVLEAGDWVTWTSDKFGYVDGVFRVEAVTLNDDWTVTLQIRQIDDAVYAWSVTDELDPANPTSLPSAAPPADVVTGVAISTTYVLTIDGAQLPAIHVSWTPITDPTVYAVNVEYRRLGDTPWTTYTSTLEEARNGGATITYGVIGNDIYQARVTPLTYPRRSVNVSATVTAGTSTVELIVQRALVSTVTEAVNPGIVTNDALEAKLRMAFDESLWTNLDRTAIGLFIQQNALLKQGESINRAAAALRADVALGLNPISSGIERIDQVQADLQAAIAATQTNLTAQIVGVATAIQNEESARATADNATTESISNLTSQVATDIAGVEQLVQAQASSTRLLAEDTRRLYVQNVDTSDAATIALFLEAAKRGEIDDDLRRAANVSSARIDTTSKATIDNGVAIASLTTELSTTVADFSASIANVQRTQSDQFGTLASQTNILFATSADLADADALDAFLAAVDQAKAVDRATRNANLVAAAAAVEIRTVEVSTTSALAAYGTQLTAAIGNLTAQVNAETVARTNADGAFATQITNVQARANFATASGQYGIVAFAGQEGAAASYQVKLNAGSISAGMRLDAMSDGTSRAVFDVGAFYLRVPGTLGPTPVFSYSAGQFLLTGNVRIDGNLLVAGSISSAQISPSASLVRQGSTAASQVLTPGTTDWFDFGSPISIYVAPRNGVVDVSVQLRAVASAINASSSSTGYARSWIRIMINGAEAYYSQTANTTLPTSTGLSDTLNDFFVTQVSGGNVTLQMQMKHEYFSNVTGSLFGKIAATVTAL